MTQRSRWSWHLAGWLTFLLCALGFLAMGVRDADALGIVASVLFLLGVIFFLVPFLAGPVPNDKE